MYLNGNPFVVWFCGIAVLVAVVTFLLGLRYRQHLKAPSSTSSRPISRRSSGSGLDVSPAAASAKRIPSSKPNDVAAAAAASASAKAGALDAALALPRLKMVAFCTAAYLMNVLPYLAVTRCAFVYHYMPALMYGQLIAAMCVEWLAGKHRAAAAVVVIAVCGLGYLYFASWVYAYPLPVTEMESLRWLDGWN